MPRRTMKELAAENAVLFGKLEELRDDLDEFLSEEPDDGDVADASEDNADDGEGEEENEVADEEGGSLENEGAD